MVTSKMIFSSSSEVRRHILSSKIWECLDGVAMDTYIINSNIMKYHEILHNKKFKNCVFKKISSYMVIFKDLQVLLYSEFLS